MWVQLLCNERCDLKKKDGAELLLLSCERIYHEIIKFLCGWMQHNDCVVMQIIAVLLVLGQMGSTDKFVSDLWEKQAVAFHLHAQTFVYHHA